MPRMRFRPFLTFSAVLLFASILFAQTEAPPASEETAFTAITDLFVKIRQGENNPSEADYKTRRETGREMAAKAKQFLKDYPTSKKADDAHALVDLGLMEAAISGDDGAATQLQTFAADTVKD